MSRLNEQEGTMNKPLSLLSQTKGVSSVLISCWWLLCLFSADLKFIAGSRLVVWWNENKLGVQIAWNIAWMYVS
ncbi:hypothetical protein L873DRAFT_593714 [Choiromyces venosus 120613-1]|uniref:Uncharacterized protein n=1 Tax=Choiromyces venosus 120613-1 TaxID=1336337 RepID=A0A3N4IZL0_9PEZI|nr:hypothetical protein L873DRAFT_593714 [Choiromyces venosus 120613-1]